MTKDLSVPLSTKVRPIKMAFTPFYITETFATDPALINSSIE